ncbi:MAG: hypothetical protein RLY97_637 [Pseudomonadota bacterium]|jgi:Skp family chaperone for outer membrane proteins
MKNTLKLLAAAALLAGTSSVAFAQQAKPAAVAAPARSGVNGIAVANFEAVIQVSNANKLAQQQRTTTYKPQFDAYDARGKAINAQLQPLYDKLNKDRAAPGANPAALQQQADAINAIQEGAKQELAAIIAPAAASDAYVKEQITDRLQAATDAAVAKNGVTLILRPEAVAYTPLKAYDITQAILNELNIQFPTALLVPPAGWEPREVRDQKAQQAAQAAQAGGTPRTGAADGR